MTRTDATAKQSYSRITIYLTSEQKLRLTDFCKRKNLTASKCIRDALFSWDWKVKKNED